MRGLKGEATHICVGWKTPFLRENGLRKWSARYVSPRVTWPTETCHWFSTQPHPLRTNKCYPEREHWWRLINGLHPKWMTGVYKTLSKVVGCNISNKYLEYITVWLWSLSFALNKDEYYLIQGVAFDISERTRVETRKNLGKTQRPKAKSRRKTIILSEFKAMMWMQWITTSQKLPLNEFRMGLFNLFSNKTYTNP